MDVVNKTDIIPQTVTTLSWGPGLGAPFYKKMPGAF